MCGIAGIINYNEKIDPELITKMLDAIVHRGPDSYGIYQGDFFDAGMRRLSIIDIEGGKQPIFNEDNSVLTFFNGEIYNYIELRAELIGKGHVFSTKSDTEVLVHLYEEYGIDFLDKLNGMFAFFLADLNKNEFYLVRDHVGIKPLYYCNRDKELFFASELKSLLKTGRIKTAVNTDAIFNYFNYLYVPAPRTIFNDIFKLEAGHYLKITRSGVENRQWFNLDDFTTISTASKSELIEETRFLLRDSVRLQMRSDVPVGAYLSGGIDSSLMTAIASEHTDMPVNTFSVGFQNSEFDELPYARKVATLFKTNHHEIIVSSGDAIDKLSELMWYMDEPIGDSAVLPSYLVSKLAVQHVKVALSGLGGDELFGGYNRYKPLVSKFQKMSFLPNPVLKLMQPVMAGVNKVYGKEINKLIYPESSADKYHNKVSQMKFEFIQQLTGRTYDPAYYGKEIKETYNSYTGGDELNQRMFTDIKLYMNDQLLHLADRTSMSVSLEARVPFLDPRLIKLALSIPSNLKVNKTDTKIILKEAIKDILPDEILNREKWGFAAPHKTWSTNKNIQELINQTINGFLVNDGILDRKGVADFLGNKEYLNKHPTWIWPLLSLESWYKQYNKLI